MDVFFVEGATPFVVSLPSLLVRTSGRNRSATYSGCIALHLPGNPCPRAVSGWQRRNLGVLQDAMKGSNLAVSVAGSVSTK